MKPSTFQFAITAVVSGVLFSACETLPPPPPVVVAPNVYADPYPVVAPRYATYGTYGAVAYNRAGVYRGAYYAPRYGSSGEVETARGGSASWGGGSGSAEGWRGGEASWGGGSGSAEGWRGGEASWGGGTRSVETARGGSASRSWR